MICVLVPVLLKRKVEVLFGILKSPRSGLKLVKILCCDVWLFPIWLCFELLNMYYKLCNSSSWTCKGNKYLQIESHWTVLSIILQ
jgi:hypothetical protein